ncbi:MAG TPA: hypothetical protein H9857_08290 [Candidatus Desulfovibrio intestinigallinarum]|nr:hypothetical protein [Candidatus Desulfovibrio intestinigallinarum]
MGIQPSAESRDAGVPFERVRRITGYLVGTLDRFNNAKRAEERDRVKHGLGERRPPQA